MKFTSVIITLMTVFSASASWASVSINCQGATDKSLTLSATINSPSQGLLKISYNNGSGMISDSQKITLESEPSADSDNYTYSNGWSDGGSKYVLDIRRHLIAAKTSGITTDINLFIQGADDDALMAYDLICKISQ